MATPPPIKKEYLNLETNALVVLRLRIIANFTRSFTMLLVAFDEIEIQLLREMALLLLCLIILIKYLLV